MRMSQICQKQKSLRLPTVTISAVVPRSTIVCIWTPIPGTIIGGSVAAAVIAAIIAIPRPAIITVARAIGVSAGRYATDHRASN